MGKVQARLGRRVFFTPAVVEKAGVGTEPLGVVTEESLMLWLPARGVNVGKCQKQARAKQITHLWSALQGADFSEQ